LGRIAPFCQSRAAPFSSCHISELRVFFFFFFGLPPTTFFPSPRVVVSFSRLHKMIVTRECPVRPFGVFFFLVCGRSLASPFRGGTQTTVCWRSSPSRSRSSAPSSPGVCYPTDDSLSISLFLLWRAACLSECPRFPWFLTSVL